MGNFYGNITLRGVDEQSVVAVLNAGMKAAFVSPATSGCVCVFEAESDGDGEALWRLAGCLSRDLECIALAIMNHDDDLLLYQLFEQGELIDSYDSCPSFSSTSSSSNPRGGEALVLCNAFGVPSVEPKIRAVLEKKYVTATNQHLDIVHLLRLNEDYSLMGYNDLVQGSSSIQLFEPTEEDDSSLSRVHLPAGFLTTGDGTAKSFSQPVSRQRSKSRLRKPHVRSNRTELESTFQPNCSHFERMSDDAFEQLLANPSAIMLRFERPGFSRSKWLTIGHNWEALDFVLAASDAYLQILSVAIAGGAPVARTEGVRLLSCQQVSNISRELHEVDFEKLLSSRSHEEFEAAHLHGFDSARIESHLEQLRHCFKQLREFFAAAAERAELVIRYKS